MKKIFDILSLVIPVTLVGWSLYLILFVYGPGKFSLEENNRWATLLILAWIYYLISALMTPFFLIDKKQKKLPLILKAYKYWVLGLFLSTFSFAIAAIIVDLSFLLKYTFLGALHALKR